MACAAALRDMVPQVTLEFLVESYKNQEGGGASCRQFVPLARGAKAYALTVFTSLDDSPDGRTGNFWAETQVVPIDWLEQAGWDAAAAFDALSWLGPRDLGRLPRNLEPEPLAPLEPGPVERLARLGELVPSDCLETLLHAVAQQSRGLRPLRLLEAQGKPASHLEEVVMLLPLTVPPTSRRYRDDDQYRCLTLRTRCPVGGMVFRTDVTGYPAAAADGLELSDGFVIDLAGRLRPTSTDDRFGRDYAHWLWGMIQQGDWDRLARLYQQAVNFPGGVFFAQYRSLVDAPSRSRVATAAEVPEPPAAAPKRAAESGPGVVEAPATAVAPAAAALEELTITPVQDWQRDSAARDELEGALWKLRENHRSQIEELVGKIGKDFAADVDKANARLVKEIAGLREGLDTKLKEFDKELKKVEKKAGKRSPQQSASVGRGRDSSSVEARLAEMERDLAEVAERLVGLEEAGGVRRRRSLREMLVLSRDWLRERLWIAWGAAIAIVMAVLLTLALRWGADKVTPELVAPTELQARKASTEALLKRAQEGKTAARLLESATLREDVAPRAHAVTLAIALSHGLQIGDELDCALLQAALREGTAVPVLGICGQKTIDALVAAPKAECCQKFQTTPIDEKKLRNCFVTDQLQLALPGPGKQVEACGGESPWRKGRSWTEEESSHALALFQRASRAFEGDRGSELDKSLRRLDPSQSPSLRENLAGETLTRDEAKRVLELAWAAWSGWEDRLGKLSANQLEELGRIVDQVAPPEKKTQLQGGGAPRATSGAR
ncbi:MAG TPA: hypothetical protein VEW48_29170 [Thermoanaerobaculia bacterium]|nr:hypothetical protein [Thermoanaerobaculia bacterium]